MQSIMAIVTPPDFSMQAACCLLSADSWALAAWDARAMASAAQKILRVFLRHFPGCRVLGLGQCQAHAHKRCSNGPLRLTQDSAHIRSTSALIGLQQLHAHAVDAA
jgi:hypothetical protein